MQYYDKKEVGFRIQQLRKSRNLTQCVLAEMLDYTSERQLQRIECGETACSVDKLMEIPQILDVSTDYILFGVQKSEVEIVGRLLINKNEKEKIFLLQVINSIVNSMELIT